MADLISVDEAQAWLDEKKLRLPDLDTDLLEQLQAQVLARLSQVYTVSTWVNAVTTPKLVRSVISMLYAARFYLRVYSEDSDKENAYALGLLATAETNLLGIISGLIDLEEVDEAVGSQGQPSFYPGDNASYYDANGRFIDDGAKFSMGRSW